MSVALWIGLVTVAAGTPDAPAPIAWSPDGRWVAYVQEIRAASPPLPAGWLFRTGAGEGAAPPGAMARRGKVTGYQLWASRPETGESVLLEESPRPLSAPAWRRDGVSVAFGRVARGTDGAFTWELVVQEAPDRRRVLRSEPLAGSEPPSAATVATLTPAWSPDGSLIAAPRLEPVGLTILRTDSGRVEKTIAGATAPAWSPGDNRLVYYMQGAVEGLWLLDGLLAEPRQLSALPRSADRVPPPIWAADAKTILTLRPSLAGSGARDTKVVFRLARTRLDGREVDTPVELTHDIVPEGKLAGVWFVLDPTGDSVFYATIAAGQVSSQMSWNRGPLLNEVYGRISPFDESGLLGGFAATAVGSDQAKSDAPGGYWTAIASSQPRPLTGMVAARVASGDSWTPPMVIRLKDEAVILVAPDEQARAEWLARILEAMWPILRERIPVPALADDGPVERPTLLPAPGELEPGEPAATRLSRLARMGLSLLGPVAAETDEARLAFTYLAGDGVGAEAALRRLLPRAKTSDQRRRLLALQAQILLMRRDFAAAKSMIDYLRADRSVPVFEVEEMMETRRVGRLDGAGKGWAMFLGERMEALKKPPAPPEGNADLVPRGTLDFDGLRLPVNPRKGQVPPEPVQF